MADRQKTTWKTKTGLYWSTCFGEVTVSTGDTVTFEHMHTLTRAHFIRASTGGLIACTEASNIATISTVALTDIHCVYIGYGVKA